MLEPVPGEFLDHWVIFAVEDYSEQGHVEASYGPSKTSVDDGGLHMTWKAERIRAQLQGHEVRFRFDADDRGGCLGVRGNVGGGGGEFPTECSVAAMVSILEMLGIRSIVARAAAAASSSALVVLRRRWSSIRRRWSSIRRRALVEKTMLSSSSTTTRSCLVGAPVGVGRFRSAFLTKGG
jgi:hypothetical protein